MLCFFGVVFDNSILVWFYVGMLFVDSIDLVFIVSVLCFVSAACVCVCVCVFVCVFCRLFCEWSGEWGFQIVLLALTSQSVRGWRLFFVLGSKRHGAMLLQNQATGEARQAGLVVL